MLGKRLMVIVTARQQANLEILMRSDGPLCVPCGTIGSSVARQVFEGGGRAVMPASHLRSAFDTSDGVSAMFDNFDFTEERTQRPLIFELLRLKE